MSKREVRLQMLEFCRWKNGPHIPAHLERAIMDDSSDDSDSEVSSRTSRNFPLKTLTVIQKKSSK